MGDFLLAPRSPEPAGRGWAAAHLAPLDTVLCSCSWLGSASAPCLLLRLGTRQPRLCSCGWTAAPLQCRWAADGSGVKWSRKITLTAAGQSEACRAHCSDECLPCATGLVRGLQWAAEEPEAGRPAGSRAWMAEPTWYPHRPPAARQLTFWPFEPCGPAQRTGLQMPRSSLRWPSVPGLFTWVNGCSGFCAVQWPRAQCPHLEALCSACRAPFYEGDLVIARALLCSMPLLPKEPNLRSKVSFTSESKCEALYDPRRLEGKLQQVARWRGRLSTGPSACAQREASAVPGESHRGVGEGAVVSYLSAAFQEGRRVASGETQHIREGSVLRTRHREGDRKPGLRRPRPGLTTCTLLLLEASKPVFLLQRPCTS